MWTALTTRQQRFAMGTGNVRRYPRAIAPFAAVAQPAVDAAADIVARGATPFLHVSDHNERAIDLYRRLGYEERAGLGLWKLQRPE
ncbi:MAG: hypothetical protein CMLOHMNK_03516 [Steroidobacteraceae bacterium]|nr:hypothetical protein [Steroidobacteraceae bacterium]